MLEYDEIEPRYTYCTETRASLQPGHIGEWWVVFPIGLHSFMVKATKRETAIKRANKRLMAEYEIAKHKQESLEARKRVRIAALEYCCLVLRTHIDQSPVFWDIASDAGISDREGLELLSMEAHTILADLERQRKEESALSPFDFDSTQDAHPTADAGRGDGA